MTRQYDAVIYEAGSRGDFPPPGRAAFEFVSVARLNPAAELTVSIGGYDADPREVFDIPEVMAFLRAMVAAMGPLTTPAEIGQIFGRFSFECRAMMLLAAGAVTREQIRITGRPMNQAGRA